MNLYCIFRPEIKPKLMMKKLLFGLTLCLTVFFSKAQVNVVNANIQAFNVSPRSLCQISIMNNASANVQVALHIQITNSANNVLIKLSTAPIQLKLGLNTITGGSVNIVQTTYGSSNQAQYIKAQNKLPSGAFNYCVVVRPVAALEEGDDYCQEIDAVENEFLYLVFPADEDTIETKTPLLSWTHSEPFNILSQGEFFKMTVVELKDDQSAEAGVIANSPVFLKNYVNRHQVQYPFDAKNLEAGKRYGWQVQKISNGNVINKTEAWEFVIDEKVDPKDHMYVTLKRKLDGSYYRVQNDKIFFRFDERYKSQNVNCKIYNDKREEITPELSNIKDKKLNTKVSGYNAYELDLIDYNLKKGFYTLEVINVKKEKFQLKFYVE